MLLLCTLPPSYDHLVTIILYRKGTLKHEDITSMLISNKSRRKNEERDTEAFVYEGARHGSAKSRKEIEG